jgi:glycosyltransferase involved in cell wall biosynthesis
MESTMSTKTLNILVDQRFEQCPEGHFWTHLPPAYPFFEKTLSIFDQVRVIARSFPVAQPSPRARRVDGPRVSVLAVPCYNGIVDFLTRQASIRHRLGHIAELDGSFLLRVPSQIGFMLAARLEALGKPYGVELLTDPWDFFAPGVASSRLASLFRPYVCARSRHLCAQAQVVNYVTGTATRRQNPPLRALWSASVSDVELNADAFCQPDLPLAAVPAAQPIEIVTVGFLDLLYKGQDVLLEALARCLSQAASTGESFSFRLTFVGDGLRRQALLDQASRLGLEGFVHVTGLLGGPAEVRKFLRRSQLFVLPSRAEGIPRALLEAMAASLPCIATSVGAMPDLLDPRWIVPPASAPALAEKLLEFARSRSDWPSTGERNQNVAHAFESSKLAPQRLDLYRAVQQMPFTGQSISLPEAKIFHAA